MTTAGPSPTATPVTTALPLLRRPDDRVLRGVCAAFGRSTGTDPVLWRVVIGVLVLFGGTGLVLYGAGWLLIPEAGSDGSIADRLLQRKLSRGSLVVLAIAAAVLLLIGLGDRNGVAPLLAAGLLVYVVVRPDQRTLRLATAEEARTAPVGGGWPGSPARPGSDAPGAWPTGPWPAAPPRRRSPLGLLTLSSALLVTGVLLGLHATGADGITVGRVLAADLLVVGLGLVAGARWGRARWLVAPAVVLAAALAVTASARVPVALSAGDRTWGAASGSHRLGFGEATLDLHGASAPADLRAEIGAGELHLRIPDGLHVEVTAVVTAGQVDLPGEPDPVSGTSLRVVRSYGPADAPLVRVRASIGAGELEVVRDV